MNCAAGLARKNTTSAIASGVTSVLPGVRARIASSACWPSGIMCQTSVATAPPETAFTVIPFAPNSTARYRLSASSAAFETPTAA